jgi:hypothetical protein
VTEFCTLCIERNLVDKMIDLPWDSCLVPPEYNYIKTSATTTF